MKAGVVECVTLAVALCSGVASCCPISFDLDRPVRDDAPEPDDAEVDLGDAEYPANNRAAPTNHPWWVPNLEPKKYRLGYKLPDGEAKQLADSYHRYADSVGHRRITKERFQWRPPPKCVGGLHCIYEALEGQDLDAVRPIAERFRSRAANAELDALQATELIVTFVQEVDYKIPEDEPFGVLPPALVAKQRWGDCDSKALLAHMLLRHLGIQSVLISSEAHRHTMLGVALPAGGSSFEWQGRRYAFVELTAKRSPVGHINPKLLRPNDWQVVRLGYRATGYDAGPKTPESEGGRKRAPERPPKPPPPNVGGGGKIRERTVVTPMGGHIRIR